MISHYSKKKKKKKKKNRMAKFCEAFIYLRELKKMYLKIFKIYYKNLQEKTAAFYATVLI